MAKCTRLIRAFPGEKEVSENLCKYVIEAARCAIESSGVFSIGLSGGSAAKYLCQHLTSAENVNWSKWKVFFCDERHVGQDDPDSTNGFYTENLFRHVPIPKENIFTDNTSLSVEDAAEDYEQKLKIVFGNVDIPAFDLLILGMGPDGHTCSLFPGHELLKENIRKIAAIKDSPKPPPERITMTFPLLLNARRIVFAACGAGKADIVKRVLEGHDQPPLPAAMVKPRNGEVIWFLDTAAASCLSTSTTS